MVLPSNGRGRPVITQTASKMDIATTTNSVPTSSDIVRCTRCHRPLRAARSVELEVGPVCAHLMVEGVAA